MQIAEIKMFHKKERHLLTYLLSFILKDITCAHKQYKFYWKEVDSSKLPISFFSFSKQISCCKIRNKDLSSLVFFYLPDIIYYFIHEKEKQNHPIRNILFPSSIKTIIEKNKTYQEALQFSRDLRDAYSAVIANDKLIGEQKVKNRLELTQRYGRAYDLARKIYCIELPTMIRR